MGDAYPHPASASASASTFSSGAHNKTAISHLLAGPSSASTEVANGGRSKMSAGDGRRGVIPDGVSDARGEKMLPVDEQRRREANHTRQTSGSIPRENIDRRRSHSPWRPPHGPRSGESLRQPHHAHDGPSPSFGPPPPLPPPGSVGSHRRPSAAYYPYDPQLVSSPGPAHTDVGPTGRPDIYLRSPPDAPRYHAPAPAPHVAPSDPSNPYSPAVDAYQRGYDAGYAAGYARAASHVGAYGSTPYAPVPPQPSYDPLGPRGSLGGGLPPPPSSRGPHEPPFSSMPPLSGPPYGAAPPPPLPSADRYDGMYNHHRGSLSHEPPSLSVDRRGSGEVGPSPGSIPSSLPGPAHRRLPPAAAASGSAQSRRSASVTIKAPPARGRSVASGDGLAADGSASGGHRNSIAGISSSGTGTGNSSDRQPISCNLCRQRKSKCNGTPPDPCEACVRRGCSDECEYVTYIRRRGPGKKRKSGAADAGSGNEGQGRYDSEPMATPSPGALPGDEGYNPYASSNSGIGFKRRLATAEREDGSQPADRRRRSGGRAGKNGTSKKRGVSKGQSGGDADGEGDGDGNYGEEMPRGDEVDELGDAEESMEVEKELSGEAQNGATSGRKQRGGVTGGGSRRRR